MTADEFRAHGLGVKIDTPGMPAATPASVWMENCLLQVRRTEEEAARADRAEAILDRIAWDDHGRAILRRATARAIDPTAAALIFVVALVAGVLIGLVARAGGTL